MIWGGKCASACRASVVSPASAGLSVRLKKRGPTRRARRVAHHGESSGLSRSANAQTTTNSQQPPRGSLRDAPIAAAWALAARLSS